MVVPNGMFMGVPKPPNRGCLSLRRRFLLVPDWFYPHRSGWDIAMWNHWARYYQTDGELGEEPPELIRDLQNWGDKLRTATTEAHRTKAAKTLLAAAAENLWTIGTVGQVPHPVVVSTPQERDADRHLGLGQPLDARLPSSDLVLRRSAREAVAVSHLGMIAV